MKKLYTAFFAVACFIVSFANAQTSGISGVINRYVGVDSIGCNYVVVDSVTGFSVGDRVLLIQMKGAVIDTSNTSSYGSVLSYGDAGNYEFATIDYISGNSIYFLKKLVRTYTASGLVQLVRVPQYADVIITDTVKAAPWNGKTGGVLSFEASGTVTLNSFIDVSGAGFRGGICSLNDWSVCSEMTYACPFAGGKSAQKGEGIVEYDTMKQCGRGQLANGGGGGNRVNAGGGGGGNYAKGGQGGYEWSFCATNKSIGGDGGDSLIYSNAVNKIFLGGGGGGGQQNNSVGTPGTRGGGIIIIKADSINGNNYSIRANGKDNTAIAGIDAAGGGGAGGVVLLSVNNVQALNVQCKGGKGGTVNGGDNTCWGPGGGGAGGVVWRSSPAGTTDSVRGGIAGKFFNGFGSCNGTSYGALDGEAGATLSGLVLPEGNSLCGVLPVGSFQAAGNLCQYDCISFTNLSTNADSYEWLFEGAQPATDTAANPASVCYTGSGDYDVTLIAKNGTDADTITITDYIHVKAAPVTPVISLVGSTLHCSTDPLYATYQWYDDTVLIAGATDTLLVISHNGNYNVHVTNYDSCSIAVGINIILGMNNAATDKFQIIPNPVSDKLIIRSQEEAVVSVIDMLGKKTSYGQLLKGRAEDELDVSGLSAGIYFLHLQTENSLVVKRFVKQ